MNKTPSLLIAVLLSSPLPRAFADQRAPELPSLAELRERLSEAALPAAPLARELAVEAKLAGCPVPALSGATIGRGMFASDYGVTLNDQKVGTIASGSDSITVKDNAGNVIASARISASGGARAAALTDCSGAAIGSILEQVGSGASRFSILDASGKTLSASGWVDGKSFSMDGEGVVAVLNAHWLLDRFTVTAKGVDGRAAVIVSVMNNAAGYRRSAERRRDRIGGGPNGGRERL